MQFSLTWADSLGKERLGSEAFSRLQPLMQTHYNFNLKLSRLSTGAEF
ncbi:hypothetical protein O77CONTIG1_04086 [Leptolyngbya sp. O-77]|nr:hypothetical protein O77CONTIG1_04086 [Leptolyngbya sp. O-77]